MAIVCPNCKIELIGNPKFCPKCGTQINKNVKPVDEVFKRRHSRRGLRLAATFGIIILIVAGVAYVFVSVLDLDSFIGPTGISGTWEGSGTFTNNCDNPACRYVGTMNPPSVILELQQNENMVFGTVTINIPDSQVEELLGQPCLGFDNSVSDINNGILSSTRLTFMDDGGNIWTLNFLSDNCQGTVGSNAIGCTGLQGDVSLSRK
jgi:hypothetical protein